MNEWKLISYFYESLDLGDQAYDPLIFGVGSALLPDTKYFS